MRFTLYLILFNLHNFMISFFADGKTEAQGDEVICESTGIQA